MTSNADAIRTAHNEGNLYVHLLEFGGYNPDFFAVLNGEKKIYNDCSGPTPGFWAHNPDFDGTTPNEKNKKLPL